MKPLIIKNTKYILFLIFVIIVLMEVLPYVVSPLLYKQSFSRRKTQEKLMSGLHPETTEAVGGEEENEYLGDHILHPYFGFVSRPHQGRNSYGFLGDNPLKNRNDSTVKIGIMGGSVAMGLYNRSADKLIETLQSAPMFSKKHFALSCFALGGYKQPQQLLILNYFLSLGAFYDIIINLDGFNEVVLPYSDNLPFEIHPSYPRHWHIYSRKKLDTDVQLLLSEQTALRKNKLALNHMFQKKIFRHSNFGLLMWLLKNNRYELAIHQTELELREAIMNSESSYQSTGPFTAVTDTARFFAEQVGVWAQSSKMMAGLSRVMGFEYFHFLQPNQYVEGSKVLTADELRDAYEHGPFSYKEAVEIGYPLLRAQALGLLEAGVHFTDLSMIFRNDARTVYIDKCCHFNTEGYNAIAIQIGQEIIRAFNGDKKAE